MRSITITEPGTLLESLFKQLPLIKKTRLRQSLKYGSIRVNGSVVTLHRHALVPGDVVDLLNEKQARRESVKENLDFEIVYEDDQIIVVDKPAGLLTMATDDEKLRTVYYQLTEYRRAQTADPDARIFIVHRLDRDSSGLVVFAKSESAKRALQADWTRAVKKYYAVSEHAPRVAEGTVRSYLVEDEYRRVYSVHEPVPESKEAVTSYRLIRDNGRYSLLEVMLKTGRKNQIRVHLSDIGCPIAGDDKYGARTDPAGRLCLHAHFLSIRHPADGQPKVFQSKLPREFRELVADPAVKSRKKVFIKKKRM